MSPSEPLRVDEGQDEIAQEGDGHDEADDVLGGHSFVTPLATRATSANTASVVTTKARSAIESSLKVQVGTDTLRKPLAKGDEAGVDATLTATPRPLTPL
jgi:hypothetical protein